MTTCVHKVKWSVKRPENCRFRLSVSHYKDRIVAPDEYSGVTVVTPSDQTQVLATKKKFVQEDITVHPAPTETLSTTSNGQFTPSSGKVGFSHVDVNVVPDLRPLSVSENGQYSPDGFDGYSSVTVNNPAEWTTEGIADGSEPNGDIDLGDVENVTPYAFFNRPISSVHGNEVTTLGNYAFNGCKNLVSVVLPYSNCGQYAFSGCSALKNLHLPRTTSIPTSGATSTGLEFLYLPSLRTVGSYCMQSNAMLETVILPECTSLNSNSTFNNCAKLTTIVLGGSAVVPIGANSLNNTPFANGGTGGHVYIRKSLYDHLGDGSNLDYLKNSVWNTLNSYGVITWHPIEGSEYETYMPGGAKYEEEMALT